MRKCSKCGIEKPINAFSKNKCSNDGYNKQCKECIRSYKKEMFNLRKQNDPEDMYRKAISTFSEHIKGAEDRVKRSRAMRAEKLKEKFAIRRYARIIEIQKRRADKFGLEANLTKEQWRMCLEYFDYKDAYTGLPMKSISQDHFIPLTKGGRYTVDNIIPCERIVNCSKNNKLFNEWYPKQSFYNKEREEKIIRYLEMQKIT